MVPYKQQNRAKKMFLNCLVYEDNSPQSSPSSTKTWIGAETSCGIRFDVALRPRPPPGFSTLYVRTDDALPDTPTSKTSSSDDDDDDKPRMNVEAVASCRDTVVIHTSVETGTYPCFRHDYYLLTAGAMLRLPPVPGPNGFNLGILPHGSGEYAVAVLKEEGTCSMIPNSLGLPAGPCVCSYSTSTNEWIVRPVSLPAHLLPRWSWDVDAVLASGTTFWWVDLHCGILSYDIAADHNKQQSAAAAVLGFIPLPPPLRPDRDEREYHLRQDRCVGVTAGELRCVHVFEDRVMTWSWRAGTKEWVQDYEMKLADLWEKAGYSETGLPRSAPEYPTVDPSEPNLVNFFLPVGKRYDGYVIGVDLVSEEVVYRGDAHKGLLHMVRGLEIFELSGEAGAMIKDDLPAPPTKRCRLLEA